jgi:hypothetical protein
VGGCLPAAALREGLVRDWSSLQPAERASLRHYCATVALTHAPPLPKFVTATLQAAAAGAWKRGWVEGGPEEREAFFTQVRWLGDAKSSLGAAKSSLGEAKSSLGDATSSLGAAKSSLGDAKSALGDAQSSP